MERNREGSQAPAVAEDGARTRAGATLPSVTLPSLRPGGPLTWSLVVVFHPDTRCIGAQALLPVRASGSRSLSPPESLPGSSQESIVFGRLRPAFTLDDSRTRTLDDPHMSRRAGELRCDDGRWCVVRTPGSSRLRINGEELQDRRVLARDELENGFSVTLAGRVVLFLRLLPREVYPPAPTVPELQALLGVSPAMRRLRAALVRAAASGDDVLLTGPTGVGKELAARAIHACGPDPAQPWVAVNMAALPTELAAASLFGVRRGAFTGAQGHREGFFQQAAGGALFLDEVGDTPASLQPLLLRALQEREVQVLGGPVERVQLRVIAATEHDPDDPDSRLRPALRYRLGTQELRLPALRERREDVGVLARTFFRTCAARDGVRWAAEVAPGAELARWVRLFELFLAYAWPGNVRELQSLVAQLYAADPAALAIPPPVLRRLEPGVAREAARVAEPVPGAVAESGMARPPGGLAQMSDEAFALAWHEADGEVARLARRLRVSRGAIYRRAKMIESCRLANDVPLGELLAALDQCRGDLETTAQRLGVSRRGLAARLRAGGARAGRVGGDCRD